MISPGLLHFSPSYHIRVWGGRRLETVLGRKLPDARPYGESWELVDRENEQSTVEAGPLAGTTLHELWTTRREEIFGACYAGHRDERFPLLIKVLDCTDDLSIQVHPPAEIAPFLNGEPKTEMWYVAHADPGARLFAGIRQGVTREAFEAAIANGSLHHSVHALEPVVGDSLFVPSGRLHALGRGLLIYEIQQNSDTTYRVYDWNRLGLDGKPRDLHVEESLRCIDFEDEEPSMLGAGENPELASCNHFKVTRRRSGDGLAPPPDGRFRLIMPLTTVEWLWEILPPGRLSLLPAFWSGRSAEPLGEWLEIELPTA